MTEKEILRREFQIKRKALSGSERKTAQEAVFRRLIQLPAFQSAQSVLLFVSYGSEVDTHQLISYSLSEGKRVLVPFCEPGKDEMAAVQIRAMDELVLGKHGILAPKEKKQAENSSIDFILTPGLAFDLEGYRLGYGRGYYDRFFGSVSERAVRVGVGFDFQLVPRLPHDPLDLPVHGIVTDRRIIFPNETGSGTETGEFLTNF